MKKLNILILGLILFVTSSCNDWLTIEPKSESSADKMFSSEMGYSNALIGLYLDLQDLYSPGKFMMGGYIEYMAQAYTVSSSVSTESYFFNHNYNSTDLVNNALSNVFLNYYKVIANANVLLEHLEQENHVLTKDKADIIKGEALAIRAFCQLELIRLWGPVPSQAEHDRAYLPYVTIFSIEPYNYTPYDEYNKDIENDFKEALNLLRPYDPILKYSNTELNSSYTNIQEYNEQFWYNRQKRFNYYGIEALLARYYWWIGNSQEAYSYAKAVVDAKAPDGTPQFRLGKRSDAEASDFLFYHEHLVAIDITDDNRAYSQYFSAGIYSQDNRFRTYLFEGQTDLRTSSNLMRSSTTRDYSTFPPTYKTSLTSLKFSHMTKDDAEMDNYGGYPKSLPLIRLSELYLILMQEAPITEANTYCNDFRSTREAYYNQLTEANRNGEVLKEYAREYWCEGQTFFAHKQMNATTWANTGNLANANNYILPLPIDETGNYR